MALTAIERILSLIIGTGSVVILLMYGGNLLCVLAATISYKLSSTFTSFPQDLHVQYREFLFEKGTALTTCIFLIDRVDRGLRVMLESKPLSFLSYWTFVSFALLLVIRRNQDLWKQWIILELNANFVIAIRYLYEFVSRVFGRWFGQEQPQPMSR